MFFFLSTQVLANLLSTPLASSDGEEFRYVAFDLDPKVVKVISFHRLSCLLLATLHVLIGKSKELVSDILSLLLQQASRNLGFPVLYGDGSRPAVLQSAGISSPKAVMVMYRGKDRTTDAVQRIRLAFPAVLTPPPPCCVLWAEMEKWEKKLNFTN